MASRFETNIFLQPEAIHAVLQAPRPAWAEELARRRVFFVGTGSSHHAARISERLWREHVGREAYALESFSFVREPQPIGPKDAVVLLSHRGGRSYTAEAARAAARAGAMTVGITGRESPWKEGLDHRLETCRLEDTGAFTKSLTASLAWVVRLIGEPGLAAGLHRACELLRDGPPFPELGPRTDLVLLGDGLREWVARETALKLQEAAYLRARAFGLEEFLHGPRISLGEGSQVVAFSDPAEPRWEAARRFLAEIGAPLVEAPGGPERGAAWMWQLFWGQRLTLDACRRLGVDPDALKCDDPRFRRGAEVLPL